MEFTPPSNDIDPPLPSGDDPSEPRRVLIVIIATSATVTGAAAPTAALSALWGISAEQVARESRVLDDATREFAMRPNPITSPPPSDFIGPNGELSDKWGISPEQVARERALLEDAKRALALLEQTREGRLALEAQAELVKAKTELTKAQAERFAAVAKAIAIGAVAIGIAIALAKTSDPELIRWIIEKLIDAFS